MCRVEQRPNSALFSQEVVFLMHTSGSRSRLTPTCNPQVSSRFRSFFGKTLTNSITISQLNLAHFSKQKVFFQSHIFLSLYLTLGLLPLKIPPLSSFFTHHPARNLQIHSLSLLSSPPPIIQGNIWNQN